MAEVEVATVSLYFKASTDMRTGSSRQVSQLLLWDLGSMGQQLVWVTHICVDSQTRGVWRVDSSNPCASSARTDLKFCLGMLRDTVIPPSLAGCSLSCSVHSTCTLFKEPEF